MLAFLTMGHAAFDIGIDELWVDRDRFRVVCDRLVVLAVPKMGGAASDIGRGGI